MRVVPDTSLLIGGEAIPAGLQSAFSAVPIPELHFGLLVASDDDTRALRVARLGLLEARCPDPLPVDDRVARERGRLQAAVARPRGQAAPAHC
jgi:hypothetical protein